MSDPLDVLAAECESFSAVIAGLSEEQFSIATRCPPWDVKDLVAHMWRNLYRIPTALEGGPVERADTDSVTYWRSYDPVADASAVAQHARDTAADYSTGAELARSFDELWRSCVAQARAEDPARVITTWWGPTLRLDEFVKTRVLETGVHGLDMTVALGLPPILTHEGEATIVSILTGLLGTSPPAQLGWDAIDFIDKGCGRAPLTKSEIEVLGRAAELFPLLG